MTAFLYRYLFPFTAGCFVSAATLVEGITPEVVLVTGAVTLVTASLVYHNRTTARAKA
jgi:hypothetical protein